MSRQGSEEVAVVIETHPSGTIFPLLSPGHLGALSKLQSHFSKALSNISPSCTAHHHDCFGTAVALQGLHLGSYPSRALGNMHHMWILPVPRLVFIIHKHATSFHTLGQLPSESTLSFTQPQQLSCSTKVNTQEQYESNNLYLRQVWKWATFPHPPLLRQFCPGQALQC